MPNPIKTSATVTYLKDHGNGVYSVTMKPQKPVPRFRPGQFLHLTVDEYDPLGGFWPESRVFSIASGPSESEIAIVYSVKGRYTGKMSQELRVGRIVWLKLPYGDFVVDTGAESGRDVLLVAGGTGITPFIPYLKKEIAAPSGRKIHLVYGVRERRLLLFDDVLRESSMRVPGFMMSVFVEQSSIDIMPAGITPFSGRITLKHILEEKTGLAAPVIFLSGPPAMIRAFKTSLLESGVDLSRIKIDEWE